MNKRHIITFLHSVILFCAFNNLYAQQTTDIRNFDYSKADSIALNFNADGYKTYADIVIPLTQDLHTDHEKFRAIFRWITENVRYSYSNRSYKAKKAYKKRKAVCIGYSNLLAEMSKIIGVECNTVIGYAKKNVNDIYKKYDKKTIPHAWNVAKFDSEWYLFDVTWASGFYVKKQRKYIKAFDEFYFAAPAKFFIKNHLPKDKAWQLLDTPITRSEFSKYPIYYNEFLSTGNYIVPKKGKINVRQNKILEFEFESPDTIKAATINLDNGKYRYYPKIERLDGCYKLKQVFDKNGDFEFTLFLNSKAIATYRLRVMKAKR